MSTLFHSVSTKNTECKSSVHCSSGQTLESLEEKELGRRGLLPMLVKGWVGLELDGSIRADGPGKPWEPGIQHLLSSSPGLSGGRITV